MRFSFLSTSSSPHARVLFWVAAAAFVVRFLYFAEHAASPFFNVPILDEKFYDTLARFLVEGRDTSKLNPGFRPWLYPFFLSVFYRLAGEWGHVLALAVQHLLGVLTAVMTAELAMRLLRRPAAGAVAGGLYLLAGPPLFFEGELLITSLMTFLAVALLLILSRAQVDGPRLARWWFAAGLGVALAAQARPNILIVLAAFPASVCWLRQARFPRRLTLVAYALAGALAGLAGAALLQQDLAGRFQLLPGAGGVNFYLGNKAGADGMVPRQDRAVTYGEEYRDSVEVFAAQLYREEVGDAGPDERAAVSRYFLRRTVEEIGREPARWAGLMGQKTLFLLWNREIPNNKNYEFIRHHESRLLRLLPVRWWLLLSLAVPGLLYGWWVGKRHLAFWLQAFLLLYALGILLFFVNSRYRIPMWPGMAVLAAAGVLQIADLVRRRARCDLAVTLLISAGLAAISLGNWLAVEPQSFARDYFFRSLAQLDKGRLDAARADARRSIELEPNDAAARVQLGNILLGQGEDELAFKHYRVASTLAPGEPRIRNNLAIILERRGRPYLAYRVYLEALELAPDFVPPLINAALLELRAGLTEPAAEKIRRAEALGDASVQLLSARALLRFRQGEERRASDLLDRARRLDEEVVAGLLEESRKGLDPRRLTIPLESP